MSIIKALNNAYKDKEMKGWDKLYFFFDLHSTIIKPNYEYGNIPTEFYPFAKEVLQFLSKLDSVVMIIYTCSHPHEIDEYIQFFEANDIYFKYVNRNPEVVTKEGGYGYYKDKPYMDVLFEDKAGFDAEKDWLMVMNFLHDKYGNLNMF